VERSSAPYLRPGDESPSKTRIVKRNDEKDSLSSSFSQLLHKIRESAEKNSENLQNMIIREYKIFRLLPDGISEEIDFVEWASNLNNRHPIAKAY
jgi:hypothetical protein